MANFFTLRLDTVGPDIEIRIPPYVLSTSDMDLMIAANEEVEPGYQNFYLMDSTGQRHDIILAHHGDYFKGKVSIGSLPLGIVTVYAQVQDTVLNLSPVIYQSFQIVEGIKVRIRPSIHTRSVRPAVKARKVVSTTKTRKVKAVVG